eukprot:Gregarina_sp_Poly_1__4695@NODE_2509_length_2045_cov_200_134479_g1594_i0_p1_GENE_NODE_2509_length_2045_cov_200_134479_g1594_i0NODE_2509_length_2045_cov_200_134479_g1594_i0_p1_ORF_typecomplete_len309_score58_61IMCp/PF12314_8/0_13IMCp/PF12314_8/28DUF816/PF05674_12/0_37Xrn1_D3/PF18194_1/4e03Xrn1_D3/PF18194_1/2_2e03Xrn1_D3/PF18194_1/0_2_NODE_2509_length_2045_cov_200_134479_g1594_i01481074
MIPSEHETPSRPLVPPNPNVIYKQGPPEQLPQFGLVDDHHSPLMSYSTTTAPCPGSATPPFFSRTPPSPSLAFHSSTLQPSPSPLPPPTRYSSALEVQRVSAKDGAAAIQEGDGGIINIVEQIVYQPVVVEIEKYVEVPEIQYREIPVNKTVEVPEVVEQVVVKEIPVPQYVEIEVPKYVEVPNTVVVERIKPVGVESVQIVTYEVPEIETEYEIIHVPIYVPQFIEVPVPVEQMDEETQAQIEALASDIATVTSQQYPSLSVLEDLFERSNNISPQLETDPAKMLEHWKAMAENGSLRTTARPSPGT